MFSSFFAQGQRTLVICRLVVMTFAISLSPHSSLFFRGRDKPPPLPDKMMRSRNLTPAVHRNGSIGVPCNDRLRPNRGKQRENLLPSCRIRSNETRLFDIWNLHDDPRAREVRPVRIQTGSDIPDVRSWRHPHLV